MKKLFKLIIGPYSILWTVQIAVFLFFMLFFDHSSMIKRPLNSLAMTIFIFVNLWLCNSLIGLLSKRREQFDARYPGKQWHIDFYRYIWPIVSVIIPFLLVLPVYFSGLYWHIQEKYYLWPEIQNSTYYLTKNHLVFTIKYFSLLCVISSFFMLVSIFNHKLKKVVAEKIVLWGFVLFFTMISGAAIFQELKLEYKNIVMIVITIFLFLWFAFFKPRKSTNPLSKSNINYYFFAGIVIFQIALVFNTIKFNGFIFPFNFYLAICLAVFSFYKAGIVPAIIGALCGLNLWSAIWWFFCLPDSILCRCKSCGKRTFSFKKVCPQCRLPLKVEIDPLISKLRNRVRPGAIVLIIIICIFVFGYNINKIAGEYRKKIITNDLFVYAPYGYSNVIIRSSGNIIGTNVALLNSKVSEESLTNDFSYEVDGENLIVQHHNSNPFNSFVIVTKPESRQRILPVIKQLALYDYMPDEINKIDELNNDAEAIDLIFEAKKIDVYNKSLYKCCEIMVSNYWYSLNEKQQRERFNYYLKMPRYRLKDFVTIIAKISDPSWFKKTPVIPDCDDIYSEKTALEILFSRYSSKLSYYRLAMCNSPLIRKICAELHARQRFFIIEDYDMASVLPYLRYRVSKEISTEIKEKFADYIIRGYLMTLIDNHDLITQEDIDNTIKALKTDDYSLDRKLPMAIDKPEIWTVVGNTNGIQWGGRYGTYRRAYFQREIKSTNAFEACDKLTKICFAVNTQEMAIDIFSRIPTEKAINKVLEILPDHIHRVAKSDAINRTEIMNRFAKQSTNYNLTAEVICDYPFPGAEEVLKSIRDKCSKENQIKIDAFLQDD